MLQRVYDAADQVLRDAMDLACLTGQPPADVRQPDRRNVKDGALVLRQEDTRTPMRIAITGELKSLIDRLLNRDRPDDAPIGTRQLLGQDWLPIAKDPLRYRFDRARLRLASPRINSSSAIYAPGRVRTRPIRPATFARRSNSSATSR